MQRTYHVCILLVLAVNHFLLRSDQPVKVNHAGPWMEEMMYEREERLCKRSAWHDAQAVLHPYGKALQLKSFFPLGTDRKDIDVLR